MYLFSSKVERAKGGRGPAFGKNVSFSLLADPGRGPSNWGLYETSIRRCPRDPRVLPVSSQLAILLNSAKAWPPALAIARDDLSRHGQLDWGPREIEPFLVETLGRRLREQADRPFVLAEAAVSEPGYKTPGEFQWILRYLPPSAESAAKVVWVSPDFCLYTDPAADFVLTPAMIQRLAETS
jgi:hypothetical protein